MLYALLYNGNTIVHTIIILTIRNGVVRRISDGTSTNVWEDRCLPSAIGNKPICKKEGATAVQVADLLTADGRYWNEDGLHQNLLSFDAKAAK
jgi:hypothetical protein